MFDSFFLNIENIRDICTILGIILVPAGWIYNEYQQRLLEQYTTKEKKYQVFLKSADALLYEDFRHPEIKHLVYEFIKEFQSCYLFVPDNVIRAGREFLKCFEELLEEPEINLSSEVEGILLDDSKEGLGELTHKMHARKKLKNLTKKKGLRYEEYLNEKERLLYHKFRDQKYPAFVEAIRKDMMPRQTKLTKEEYIAPIPTQIKVRRHFEFVGRTIAHLILLIAEAKKNENLKELNYALSQLMRYLKPHFQDIDYKIEKEAKIIFMLGENRYDSVTFLEKLSINEVLGWDKALEVKQILERRWASAWL